VAPNAARALSDRRFYANFKIGLMF